MKTNKPTPKKLKGIFKKGIERSLIYSIQKQSLLNYFKKTVNKINEKCKHLDIKDVSSMDQLLQAMTKISGFEEYETFKKNINMYLKKRAIIRRKFSKDEIDFLWILHSKDFDSFEKHKLTKLYKHLKKEHMFLRKSIDFLIALREQRLDLIFTRYPKLKVFYRLIDELTRAKPTQRSPVSTVKAITRREIDNLEKAQIEEFLKNIQREELLKNNLQHTLIDFFTNNKITEPPKHKRINSRQMTSLSLLLYQLFTFGLTGCGEMPSRTGSTGSESYGESATTPTETTPSEATTPEEECNLPEIGSDIDNYLLLVKGEEEVKEIIANLKSIEHLPHWNEIELNLKFWTHYEPSDLKEEFKCASKDIKFILLTREETNKVCNSGLACLMTFPDNIYRYIVLPFPTEFNSVKNFISTAAHEAYHAMGKSIGLSPFTKGKIDQVVDKSERVTVILSEFVDFLQEIRYAKDSTNFYLEFYHYMKRVKKSFVSLSNLPLQEEQQWFNHDDAVQWAIHNLLMVWKEDSSLNTIRDFFSNLSYSTEAAPKNFRLTSEEIEQFMKLLSDIINTPEMGKIINGNIHNLLENADSYDDRESLEIVRAKIKAAIRGEITFEFNEDSKQRIHDENIQHFNEISEEGFFERFYNVAPMLQSTIEMVFHIIMSTKNCDPEEIYEIMKRIIRLNELNEDGNGLIIYYFESLLEEELWKKFNDLSFPTETFEYLQQFEELREHSHFIEELDERIAELENQ
ncbi:hypothetical protein ACFL0W_01935 [Nanoarchaeota archaeon]